MWHQSDCNTMELQPLEQFGWKIVGDSLTMEWDSEENIDAVQQRVSTLLRGCKCRTGCGTSRCGCRQKGKQCSGGCECINCSNTANCEAADDASLLPLTVEEDILRVESLDEQVDDIMEWVFGAEYQEDNNFQCTPSLED